MTFFKKHRTLYRFQQFVTYLAVMPVLVLGSSLTLIANPPANPGDEATKDVLDKITRVRDDLGKRSLDYEDKAKNGGHDEEITKMFEEGAERYGKDWVTLFNFAQELEDSFCIISKEELKDALEALERYKNGMLGRANSREASLEESKQRLTDRVANEKDRPNGTDLPPGFPPARSFNQKQISQLKSFIKLETIMIDSMRKYAESINQLIKQILELRKKCDDCGYSASTATAVAEVILPKGTPVVTVPIPTDSIVRFHEDATVLVSTDSATASVDDPATFTPRRVKRGDEIPGKDIVTVLLDSGTGFITPHTPKLPDITVHTGRDPIIDQPADPDPTNPDPTNPDPTNPDPTNPEDPTNPKDPTDPEDPTEPEKDPLNDPPPPVTLNGGALVLSILSKVPFSETSIGTKTSSITSTKCHFEIFVDGKKHGEAVTFTGLKEEDFKDEPVRIRTHDEEGDTLTEWETDSRVEDASIQLRFNRARYQLGEAGLLLISNQDSLLRAEAKRRIGHPSTPADWNLSLVTSANVAGPPTTLPFTTHSVPFTVAGPGQLQATVTASLNQPPEDFPYVVDVPLPPGIIPANLLPLLQQYFSPLSEEINDEPAGDGTNDVASENPNGESVGEPTVSTPDETGVSSPEHDGHRGKESVGTIGGSVLVPGTTVPLETIPETIGDEFHRFRCLDIDIHRPLAQDENESLIPEETEGSIGAYTLRNDDIDVGSSSTGISHRIVNFDDLLTVEGIPDLSVPGKIPHENDLVRIDLYNHDKSAGVYLKVFTLASENGKRIVKTNFGKSDDNGAQIRSVIGKNRKLTGACIKVYRKRTREEQVSLPYHMKGPKETLYVEGLKAGRYRLTLFRLASDSSVADAKNVGILDGGDPNVTPAASRIKLTGTGKSQVSCYDHVRLTVAVVNIRQTTRQKKPVREHLFDVLWGGIALVDGQLWPPGGKYQWKNDLAPAGADWVDGRLRDKSKERVKSKGSATGSSTQIHEINGGFRAPHNATVGQAINASQYGKYAHRLTLSYNVEGVELRRDEPLTIMVPNYVDITPVNVKPPKDKRGNRRYTNPPLVLGQPCWSVNEKALFTFKVEYKLYDQLNRRLQGNSRVDEYQRQYGSILRMYEALQSVFNAQEIATKESRGVRDILRFKYHMLPPRRPPHNTATMDIETRQRRRSKKTTETDGVFTDTFHMPVHQEEKSDLEMAIMNDLRFDQSRSGRTIFTVRQDIVVLLENGHQEFDVRVTRGNRLNVLAPQRIGTGKWRGLGFKIELGETARTNNRLPDLVGPDHLTPK